MKILSIILRRTINFPRVVQMIEFILCVADIITFLPTNSTAFFKYTIYKKREESLFPQKRWKRKEMLANILRGSTHFCQYESHRQYHSAACFTQMIQYFYTSILSPNIEIHSVHQANVYFLMFNAYYLDFIQEKAM